MSQYFFYIEELGAFLLLQAFQEKGLFLKSGEKYKKAKLKRKLHVEPKNDRLFDALLDILERNRMIQIVIYSKFSSGFTLFSFLG